MQTFKRRMAPRRRPGQSVETALDELAIYVEQQLGEIERAAQAQDDSKPLRYLAVAPDKPTDGVYLSEAGVLGVTRGLYRYDSDSETYTLIS